MGLAFPHKSPTRNSAVRRRGERCDQPFDARLKHCIWLLKEARSPICFALGAQDWKRDWIEHLLWGYLDLQVILLTICCVCLFYSICGGFSVNLFGNPGRTFERVFASHLCSRQIVLRTTINGESFTFYSIQQQRLITLMSAVSTNPVLDVWQGSTDRQLEADLLAFQNPSTKLQYSGESGYDFITLPPPLPTKPPTVRHQPSATHHGILMSSIDRSVITDERCRAHIFHLPAHS